MLFYLHAPDDDKSIGDLLGETDQDIGDEQVFKGGLMKRQSLEGRFSGLPRSRSSSIIIC